MQSADLNSIELVLDELDRKVRIKQPTSAANFRQLLQERLDRTIFSPPPVFGGKNAKNLWSSDSAQRGHFDESKVKEDFFVFFGLICI